MRYALPLLLLLAGACVAPQTPAAKAVETARELNTATRFGRMDIAMEHVSSTARGHFLERRAKWGGQIRVVDLELGGMNMPEKDKAIVFVNVAWMRMNEGTLRSTRLMQRWENDKGWKLVREKRASGDIGLFGEPVIVLKPKTAGRDVHFPSRTIR